MRIARGAVSVAIAGLLAIVACGSDDVQTAPSGDGGTSSSTSSGSSSGTTSSGASTSGGPGTLCAEWANAMCAWHGRCAVSRLKLLYGDVDACRARETLDCERTAKLDGVAPMTAACISEVESSSCATLADAPPMWLDSAACDLRGSRVAGAKCERHRQCQSGVCTLSGLAGCGTCKERVAENGACTPYGYPDCQRGLKCMETTKTCQRPSTKGESCVATAYCAKPLRCTSQGSCVDPSPKDAPCSGVSTYDSCDVAAGFECRSGTCQEVLFANVGETCNTAPTFFCRGGLKCTDVDGGQDTCVPYVADGQTCGSSAECWWPMTCVNGTCAMAPPNEDCR